MHFLHVYPNEEKALQALTLSIFHTCPWKTPLHTKLVPEKNLLVLLKILYSVAIFMLFYDCPRTSVLFTLLVPIQYIHVPDNRTVLNVKHCLVVANIVIHYDHTCIHIYFLKTYTVLLEAIYEKCIAVSNVAMVTN